MLTDVKVLAPVCGLEEGGSELQMNGFEFVNMADYGLKYERYASNLFPYCSHEMIAMMKNMGYMLNMGLGKEGKRLVKFPNIETQMTKEGLGFPEGCDKIKKNHGTLNGNFVKEGGDFPYCGFPEHWVYKDGRVYLGWEIFFNEKLTFEEKLTVVIKKIQEEVYWVNYMDDKAIETMIKTSGDVLSSLMKSQVILPNSSCLLWGPLIIGLGLGFLRT